MYSVWEKYVWMIVKMQNFLISIAADNCPVQRTYTYDTLIVTLNVWGKYVKIHDFLNTQPIAAYIQL